MSVGGIVNGDPFAANSQTGRCSFVRWNRWGVTHDFNPRALDNTTRDQCAAKMRKRPKPGYAPQPKKSSVRET